VLELLNGKLGEVPSLRKLRWDSRYYDVWYYAVVDILRLAFGPDSDECKRFEQSALVTPFKGTDPQHQDRYDRILTRRAAALLSIVNKYDMLAKETGLENTQIVKKESMQGAVRGLDEMQFHPKVIEVSKSLFETGHYSEAIFAAFKAVTNFVQKKTGSNLDGKTLMAQVFSETSPMIRLNQLKTPSDKDEQEGFKFLFMGAVVGIRNPKAHDNVKQVDPYRTLEYLALASLLVKRVDEGVVKRSRKRPKASPKAE
jgi:uncharacterized protein (TIGR02391 family)